MSLSDFANAVETDPRTLPLLRDIARQAAADGTPAEPPPTYADPALVPLLGIAAIALYRLAKLVPDYLRGRATLDLAARQLALVQQVVADGVPRAQAEKVVAAMLKTIHDRTAGDPALKTVLELAGQRPAGE